MARYVAIVVSSVSLYTLSLLSLALPMTGCTDAGKCRRGELDCRCDSEGLCETGLSCNVDSICVEQADAGPTGPRDAGPPPDIDCDGTTVEEVCGQFCEALCLNQERFCLGSECNENACSENGEVALPCTQQCNTVACARNLCMNQLDPEMTCESFGFEADGMFVNLCLDADPLCVPAPELGCTNTCGTMQGIGGQLVNNGRCEDGHDTDSVASRCPRGTDCDDCTPHPCVAAGDECVNHGDCCGFFGPGALCVDPDGDDAPMAPYCLVVCNEDDTCAEGFRCVPTDGSDPVCVPMTSR